MKNLIHFVLLIILALQFSNCASSSKKIIELNLPPQKDMVVEIRPFSEAKRYVTSKGFKWRGALTDLIDKKNGLYTSLNDNDYKEIRKILINSLRESRSFGEIYDIHDENESFNGIRLFVCFDDSGIKQTTMTYVCFINACSWTTTPGDSMLIKREIHSKGSSNWSATGAQEEAITQFINEVAQLLASKSEKNSLYDKTEENLYNE